MNNYYFYLSIILLCLCSIGHSRGQAQTVQNTDTGYELWLNYKPVQDLPLKQSYIQLYSQVNLPQCKYDEVIAEELKGCLKATLGITPRFISNTRASIQMSYCKDKSLGMEGYLIRNNNNKIILQAYSDAGFLYGTFHLIRLIQCEYPLDRLNIREVPALDYRQLNHWDDLNGNIERGYAGKTLWKWDELPERLDERYTDYARANASIGINGVVLNNVNADPRILRRDYLKKVSALAHILRKYNIRIYLAANFAAPMKPSSTPDVMKKWGGVGELDTANPLDPNVQEWWNTKVDEIYSLIPDFGGFLVKANSEGMPGPQDYHCTHAEGANVLARALKPHGGIVIWRTFVYNPQIDKDRIKRSYKEFLPLDGKFDENVILQAKNGALDFQPIEPAQPLFGAMKQTSLMPELQITQEYIGQSTYLVYLAPMWKEFLNFDTYCKGAGSNITKIITGKVYPTKYRAMAGVANTGDSNNWTGHHFAQANWFAFGRLAWNPKETIEKITSEWIKSTWNCDRSAERVITQMMMPTWNNYARSHSPYSLGLTTQVSCHYRAGFDIRANKEWKIDNKGIGTNRTFNGTDYVSQYFPTNCTHFNDIKQCPELYLLCFHYVPWNHLMKSGDTFEKEFVESLKQGVQQVEENIQLWRSIREKIDSRRFEEVMNCLLKEQQDAKAFYESAVGFFSAYLPHK
ncbi:alpha-glucuronidase [Bacteroides faecichinchillae]|uniref:Xylan alpha-1,2-glucuronidase n=1 Tax=Bacteroides faecichinchillae TaxID=871325 RepID=A0A1M5F861_9BACE|nr:alpha-glucuronidase family glycosyl hydrolase [Bacteroides faecichinchillae]THG58051.1 alpha-glucuronidase [Bacteroides faecichinchillae]SHF87705.1 alpha-glucuronidase [Bacteroides faecichinchillae]